MKREVWFAFCKCTGWLWSLLFKLPSADLSIFQCWTLNFRARCIIEGRKHGNTLDADHIQILTMLLALKMSNKYQLWKCFSRPPKLRDSVTNIVNDFFAARRIIASALAFFLGLFYYSQEVLKLCVFDKFVPIQTLSRESRNVISVRKAVRI